jgi:hypothetical protein
VNPNRVLVVQVDDQILAEGADSSDRHIDETARIRPYRTRSPVNGLDALADENGPELGCIGGNTVTFWHQTSLTRTWRQWS